MKRKIETYCCYVLQVFWSPPTTTYISIKKIPICVTNVPTNFVEMMLRLISNPQYATLQKYFSHPNLVIYLFIPNPSHKIKIGLQIGRRLLVATTWTNHYDWLIKNMEYQLDHIYYIPLWQMLSFVMPFYQPLQNS